MKLCNFETITCVPQASENGKHKENTYLTILKLEVIKRLDIISLQHIAAQLNQVLTCVINFRLVVLTEIIIHVTTPPSSEMKIFMDKIKRVKLYIRIEGDEHFIFDKGKSPSLNASEIYRDHYSHNTAAESHDGTNDFFHWARIFSNS